MGKRLSSPDRLLLFAIGLGLGLALVLLWTLGGGLAPTAHAASFTVTRTDDPAPDGCTPGDCSLREAIIDANAAPGAVCDLEDVFEHLLGGFVALWDNSAGVGIFDGETAVFQLLHRLPNAL